MLNQKEYKNAILFLKGSIQEQLKPEMQDVTVTIHQADADVAQTQIRFLIKELSYLQAHVLAGNEIDRARAEMLLATFNTANNLYAALMETCVNVIKSNIEASDETN